jgi:hypothetical protein
MKTVMCSAAVVVAMALPVWAATDYFPAAGAGSFDTYAGSGGIEGYGDTGGGISARLGFDCQGYGWLAWNANNYQGVNNVSVGDSSGQTMAQFIAANGGAIQSTTLWIDTVAPISVGTWAVETLRCGNSGPLQADNGPYVGYTYSVTSGMGPAPNIAGAAEPYAVTVHASVKKWGDPRPIDR